MFNILLAALVLFLVAAPCLLTGTDAAPIARR
jgi:hypothetical protein